jgi:regulator of protease activity HflC (stomatin/prohibitin superfamily)
MQVEDITNLIVLALLLALVAFLATLAIRIVPEYQRLVVFRLGRVLGAQGPGLVLLIPFVDRGVRADAYPMFV